MVEADDARRRGEDGGGGLKAEQTDGRRATSKAIDAEHGELQAALDQVDRRRGPSWCGRSRRDALALFERVAQERNGVAVAEARDGICTICHVRLRPQVFNDGAPQRSDHPVRQLQPDPLLRAASPAAARSAPAPSSTARADTCSLDRLD